LSVYDRKGVTKSEFLDSGFLFGRFQFQHFHNSQPVFPDISCPLEMELNVAKDKIVTNLNELHSDVWMMDLEPRQ
jgi:hypothetical protein